MVSKKAREIRTHYPVVHISPLVLLLLEKREPESLPKGSRVRKVLTQHNAAEFTTKDAEVCKSAGCRELLKATALLCETLFHLLFHICDSYQELLLSKRGTGGGWELKMTFHLFHSNDPGFLLSYSLRWKECRSAPSPVIAPQLEIFRYNKRHFEPC